MLFTFHIRRGCASEEEHSGEEVRADVASELEDSQSSEKRAVDANEDDEEAELGTTRGR